MAEDSLPTAEEYALFREAYAETYPVRLLMNAIDAKDAEIERLQMLLDAALKRLAENDEEIMRLRAVAVSARSLAMECEDRGYSCEVPEHRLVALESALEAAGYGMSEEEAADGAVGA